MFGWIEDAVTEIIEDTIDVATAVVTLGEYGDLNKGQILRMVENGVTLAALASTTGVALEVLEEFMEDE